MKLPFRRKREKKNAGSEPFLVSKVRVMYKTASTRSQSTVTTPTKRTMHRSQESTADAQPPRSPTSVKEFACSHQEIVIEEEKEADSSEEKRPRSPSSVKEFALSHPERVIEEEKEADSSEEEKEADISDEWNSSNGSQYACGHSFPEILSESDAAKVLKDLTKLIINMKVEDFQEKYHIIHQTLQNLLALRDVGDFAVIAVQKNRNEMEELFGKIEKDSKVIESSVANPMSWLRDNYEGIDSIYNQSELACTNMNFFSTPVEKPSAAKDVVITVQTPSNNTASHRSVAS